MAIRGQAHHSSRHEAHPPLVVAGLQRRSPRQRHDRPGDDFSDRACWPEILEPHGWRLDHTGGDEGYWTRPGKNRGTSATTNFRGNEKLYVFTSSTNLKQNRGYSKFAAFAE